MNTQPHTPERQPGDNRTWLAALLMRRDPGWLARLLAWYDRLQGLTRSQRRRLAQRGSLTLAGAALLLALSQTPALSQVMLRDNTIDVVNGEVAIVNNGQCSLMEAIINARHKTNPQRYPDCAPGDINGPDTVRLPQNGEFVLTYAHNDQFGPTGLPVITTDMVLKGNGSTIRRDNAPDTPEFRILAIDPGAAFTLLDTTISGGYFEYASSGAGIINYGTLTIKGSTIADNYDFWDSCGGLENEGTATIIDSTFEANTAYDGGAICNSGDLTIENSTFTDNLASAAYYASGGAILSDYFGSLTVSGSTFTGNLASGNHWSGGGAISIRGSQGALIEDSTFIDNASSTGGAVLVEGEAIISGSVFSENSAFYDRNGYGLGGAIFSAGDVTVVNSTISGNAAVDGGGLGNGGRLTIINSTVTNNISEGKGGGVAGFNWWWPYDYDDYDCSTTVIERSIISGNTADTNASDEVYIAPYIRDCQSVGVVDAYNVFGHSGSAGLEGLVAGASDVVPVVPITAILAGLADNGGPTWTHALPPNSPAVDLAPSTTCSGPPVSGVDQRGQPRSVDGNAQPSNHECDAGAYELQPIATVTPTATATTIATTTPTATPSPTPTATATATMTSTPIATVSPTPGPSPTSTNSPTAEPPQHTQWLPFVVR